MRIYLDHNLDHNATTPVDPRVVDAVTDVLRDGDDKNPLLASTVGETRSMSVARFLVEAVERSGSEASGSSLGVSLMPGDAR